MDSLPLLRITGLRITGLRPTGSPCALASKLSLILRQTLCRAPAFICAALLACLTLSPVALADDTEIFFGQAGDGASSNPNILFILDTSGSMGWYDGQPTSRMDRLKDAMNQLLDQSSSFNVGLMGFSARTGGGSVRYPIGYLEGETGDDCPEEGCPDEVVVAKPAAGTDDAVEIDATGVVTVDADDLSLGEITSDDSTSTIPLDAPVLSAAKPASASVSEAIRNADGVVQHKTNETSDSWFYYGTAGTHTRQSYAYRFDDINIPPGATITTASIRFVFDGTANQTGEVSAYLSAESTASPEPYPDALAIPDPNPLLSARDKTSVITIWNDIPAGVGNDTVDTPELSNIMQEVIGLPGWASGNSISFTVDSTDTATAPADAIRQFHGVTAPDIKRPVLTYSYVESGDSTSGLATFVAQAHTANFYNPNTLETTIETASTTDSIFYLDDEHEATQLAYRFDDVNIPPEAVITSAFLKFWNTSASGQVSAKINAELTDEPLDYTILELAARTPTVQFEGWDAIPDTVDDFVESVDIKSVISEVTGQDIWVENGSLSVMLSAGSEYSNDGTHLRQFDSSSGTHPPELVVSWTVDNETTIDETQALTTGIRFTNLQVPPGAVIKSAVLEFNSHATSDVEASLTLVAEKSGNSAGFESTAANITSRASTTNSVIWPVEEWSNVNEKYVSLDVTPVVQEVTDLTDWCGGNALTMIVSGTGLREAVSFDKNPVAAPRLRVTYSPDTVPSGAFCSNRSLVASIGDPVDDATQLSNGSVETGNASLELSQNGSEVGLRFRGLLLDQGAEIINATLELSSAADHTGGATLQIQAEASDNAAVFSSASNDISGRDWSSISASWGPLPPTIAEDSIYSSDITALISSTVQRPGWQKGNALALRLSGGAGGTPDIISVEASEALSARLIVYYRGERTAPGTLFRENLKNEVSELQPRGATPIVEALYEAGQYFTGTAVDYGKKRGRQLSSDIFHRVSHPFSYDGGTVYRDEGCTNGNLNSTDCVDEEILGNPVYESPISSRCQQNHIVLLSDGAPTSNNAENRVRNKVGAGTCSVADNDSTACGVELVEWLHNNDHASEVPGEQNVTTHTIAFNLDDPAFLQDLATGGGGGYYAAESAAELLNAFKNIFVNVSKSDTSFVAPSTSVNQFNRLKHRDDIYFAQFKPESTARWNGNLKKYKVQGVEGSAAVIVDSNGDPAINQNDGSFYPSSTSFWSSDTDGGDVTKGGAANKFAGQSRKIFTNTGSEARLSAAVNALSVYNDDLDRKWLVLPPALENDLDYQNKLLNWAAGFDAKDEDGDGNTSESRTHMGDPLHSQPLLLNYAGAGAGKSVIFIGTNEGYLHAVDHLTGYEEFSFVPQELLKNLQKFYDNDPARKRIYGIDGAISAWLSDENNNGTIDPGEKALLYFGLRRGGNSYYAIDVSDLENPSLAFRIEGGKQLNDTDPLTADGDYRELAQSWSKVSKAQVMNNDTATDVLIFSGGYNPNQDPSSVEIIGTEAEIENAKLAGSKRRVDGSGRGVFIADALTGKLLWQTTAGKLDYGDMLYSMPADIRVIDINSDGLADQLYASDTGGQVWRFDIDNNEGKSESLDKRISGGVIAKFGNDDPGNSVRFYYPPDVAAIELNGRQELAISIGSGWRAHPLHTGVNNRFYSFRMQDVFGPPLDSFDRISYTAISDQTDSDDMLNVTDDLGKDASSFKGWYLDLEDTGEKVLSTSITIDNQVIFTTYVPADNIEVCSAAVGMGKVYAVSVFNGDPVLNLDGAGGESGAQLIKGDRDDPLDHAGIPPSPTIIFPEVGDATILLGPETFDEADVGKLERRTYWREHLDDNS